MSAHSMEAESPAPQEEDSKSAASSSPAEAPNAIESVVDAAVGAEYSLESLIGRWRDSKGACHDLSMKDGVVSVRSKRPGGRAGASDGRGVIGWDANRQWIV